MRILTFLLISSCFAISALGQSFTGKIVMTNSLQPDKTTTILLDGDKAAFLPAGPGIYKDIKTVIDRSNGDYYSIVPLGAKIRVSKMNLSDAAFSSHTNGEMKVIRTKETKTINGYQCVKYLVESTQGMTELWVAPALKNIDLASFMSPKTLLNEGKYFNLDGVKGFVLEAHGISARGGQSYTVKNTVEPQSVDASVFVIPTGSNVIDVNALNQQIKKVNNDPQKLRELKQNLKEIHKN